MTELRGNPIPVIAKHRIEGVFEVGDELIVQSILHTEPKLLVNALCGAYTKDGVLRGMRDCPKELRDEPIGTKLMMDKYFEGQYLIKAFDATFAPIGSYHYSIIILKDGREVNDSVLGYRTLEYAFDKRN